MLKYKTIRIVEVQDWDALVKKTYNKPYSFQQQDGCKERGTFNLTVPSLYADDEYMNIAIPEEVNGREMGVRFNVWLNRDPQRQLGDGRNDRWRNELFWERNFYPDVYTVANDLYKKGLIEKGDYIINIDW